MSLEQSIQLFERAARVIPGGVNSPVRAFKSVGMKPLFIKSARGAHIYDEDGNAYLELINSWGPMVLGHAHPVVEEAVAKALKDSLSFGAPTLKEILMAEQICKMVPSIEQVRMVNSGTEATMAAIRLARGYTGKAKIIKFDGCYHGHGDSFLIAAGSGVATLGIPGSPGVTNGTAADTLVAQYNNLNEVDELFQKHEGQIAAIIVEPVAGNMGCVLPQPGFLEGLRALCDKYSAILIFDEVMTGFRLSAGGAQTKLGISPDLTTLGKIIGGGLPVGAYGGKKEIMQYIAPAGPVYQAGTLSGNPIAMSAGLAVLTYLEQNTWVYDRLDQIGYKINLGMQAINDKLGLHNSIVQMGSMFTYFFTPQPVHNFDDAKLSDTQLFAAYFREMIKRGVYPAPSQFESLFVSVALTDELIEEYLYKHEQALTAVIQ